MSIRIIALMSLLLAILSPPFVKPLQAAYLHTGHDSTYLWESPNYSSKIICTLPEETVLKIKSTTHDWYNVYAVVNGKNYEGWIRCSGNILTGKTKKALIEKYRAQSKNSVRTDKAGEARAVKYFSSSYQEIDKDRRNATEESCYELGYRWGLCATKSLYGIPCKSENDFVTPERCRGKSESLRGIQAGAKAVYDTLNLDTESSNQSSSLNMLSTPLDVLRNELTGRTKSEVRRLVGSPDRIEVFAGKKCWVYGKTHTSKDRGIVFNGDKVLTVTFY